MSEEQNSIQPDTTIQDKKDTSSYRGIFKATSIFGGVRVFEIIISIIRSKFVAMILGTTGIGVSGLYHSSTSLIRSITSFGLSTSAVRNVAAANSTGDINRINRVVTTIRKLVWITGGVGMAVTILLSPLLSKNAFGNYEYTLPFILLSVTLLLEQLADGQMVVLRGLRKLSYLAKSRIIGLLIGLFVTIPLYYVWGVKAIAPNLVLASLTTYLLSTYFSKKVPIQKVKMTFKETMDEGKGILGMGFVLTLNGILVLGVHYVVRTSVATMGGISEVGFYTAGSAILNTYIGMIFNAMTTDYYPRLAGVSHDEVKFRDTVNQQGEIALLMAGPLLVVFLLFIPIVIVILYSKEFLPMTEYMQWAAVGVVFRVIAWTIGYQFMAKGDTKTFIINETVLSVISLIASLIGYRFFGKEGLGMAYLFMQLFSAIYYYIISHKKYGYTFGRILLRLFFIQLSLVLSVFLLVYLWDSPLHLVPGIVLAVLGIWYSFKELNKRIELIGYLKRKRKK